MNYLILDQLSKEIKKTTQMTVITEFSTLKIKVYGMCCPGTHRKTAL